MRASAIKYLYWRENYNVRQVSIITGASEDYVRKVIKEERAKKAQPSYEDITEAMVNRKEVIDQVMSLKGAYWVSNEEKFAYVSLLAYLGYSVDELHSIFYSDKDSFINTAALRSKKAWQGFDSSCLGIDAEKYRETFLESGAEAAVTEQQKEDRAAKAQEDYEREQRRLKKLASQNCKKSKN